MRRQIVGKWCDLRDFLGECGEMRVLNLIGIAELILKHKQGYSWEGFLFFWLEPKNQKFKAVRQLAKNLLHYAKLKKLAATQPPNPLKGEPQRIAQTVFSF